MNQFRFSVDLLQRNYSEVHAFASYLTSARVANKLGAVENRWRQHEAIREVLFLLHNYAAAAQSLVDHSRVAYGHLYQPGNLIPNYQAEIDARFVTHPLSQFMVSLRQMAQHYRLPSIGLTLSFRNTATGTVFEAKLLLRRADLEDFSGWKPPAKKFLQAAGEEIDVLQLIETYHTHVMDFHQWFRTEQARVHGIGPELLSHLTRHGVAMPTKAIVAALARNVEALEKKDRAALTFADLWTALDPVLTEWDYQVLGFCEHSAQIWLESALGIASARFDIPEELRARYFGLLPK